MSPIEKITLQVDLYPCCHSQLTRVSRNLGLIWFLYYSFSFTLYASDWSFYLESLLNQRLVMEWKELGLRCSDSLVDNVLGFGLRVRFPIRAKDYLSWHSRQFRIPKLNKGSPPVQFPSLWGTRVQAECLGVMRGTHHTPNGSQLSLWSMM